MTSWERATLHMPFVRGAFSVGWGQRTPPRSRPSPVRQRAPDARRSRGHAVRGELSSRVGMASAENSLAKSGSATVAMEDEKSERKTTAPEAGEGAGQAAAGAGGAVSYFSLFKYADWEDYIYITVGTVGAVGDGMYMPILVVFVIRLVNAFNVISTDPAFEKREADKWIVYMMVVAPIFGVFGFLEASCWMRTGERQAMRIRSKYLRAVLRQNEAFFDTRGASSAEVVNSISADTTAIQEAMSEKVGTFIAMISQFIGGLAVSIAKAWQLGLIWVAAIPILVVPVVFYGKRMGASAAAMHAANKQAGGVAEQAVSSIHTVYSFVGEKQVLRKYSTSLTEVVDLGVRMGIFKSLAVGTAGWAFAIWSLVLWVGSRLVVNDGLKGANVINGGFVAVNGILGLGLAFGLVKFFAEGCRAAKRIFEVIDRVPEIDSWDDKGKVLKKVDGSIELRNIAFSYPARPKATIFSNLSLTIPAGCKVALVGDSGSGKSTVIALLERFYDPLKGQVLVDGVDIKELQLKWLRTQIGLVSQEPALFATSVRENIMLGNDNATVEEVTKACKHSNAHGFVEEFPDQYETQVGERGVKMSGGQKQRLAIARAILKNPPILLLDEATSALDAESEKVVQDALDTVSAGRTTVIVAHRLSTIRDADLIAVMKDGQVVELGSHEKLISTGGAYAELVHLQQTRPETQDTDDLPYRRRSSREIGGSSHSQRISYTRSLSHGTSKRSDRSVDDMEAAEFGNATFEKPSPPSFRKLLAMNRPEWKQALLGSFGAICFGCMYPFYSFLLASMMTGLYNPDHHALTVKVRKFCFYFLAIAVGAWIFSFLQHFNFAVMGERLTKRLRERLLGKILMFEVGWFDDEQNSSGAISSRLATEANVARALVSDRMSLLLQTGSAIIVAAAVSLSLSWKLAAVMLALQPLTIICYMGKGQVLRLMYQASLKSNEDSAQVASEAVSQHRTVTAFSAEDKVINIFDNLQTAPKKVRAARLRAVVAGLGLGLGAGLIVFSFAFSFWWAQRLLERGELRVSALFKVFFMIIATGRMIGEAGSVATDIARSANSIVKVFTILDRRSLIDSDDKDGKKLDKVDGVIELKDVEFAYPTRPDVRVFKKLNLKVREGRNLALVGRSGSGKSSVVALIERFYDPMKGTINIDGIDIRKLHLQTLRKHIALVSQEPTLFMGSIRENIQYGRENATEAEIVEAAKAANAHNFICSLKDGFDTSTGDRGLQLSGGQKQRIAIARALLKNPSILLLDEATSALDAQSEKVVQDALDTVMVGRTTIVVAHRLSTIQNCDSIAVIQEGVVCEQGSHGDLLAKGGAYSALINLQNKAGDV